MICNLCGKQEASVHLTEIVNDQMMEIHLCEKCAQEKGTDFKTHFNFSDLLTGLVGSDPELEVTAGPGAMQCLQCKMTYDQFAKSGRLGCPACYQAFTGMLLPLIKRVQRSSHHIGKKPSRLPQADRNTYDLRLLQDRLRRSVEAEAFEEAARLRDEIRKIEQRLKKDGKNA